MALKKLNELEQVEDFTSQEVLLNDAGVAKRAKLTALQSDWDETDETSPKFIMNKPSLNTTNPVYIISNGILTEFDGTPITSKNKIVNDFLNGSIRVLYVGYMLTTSTLEENLINLSGTVVGFSYSASENRHYITIAGAANNEFTNYKCPELDD